MKATYKMKWASQIVSNNNIKNSNDITKMIAVTNKSSKLMIPFWRVDPILMIESVTFAQRNPQILKAQHHVLYNSSFCSTKLACKLRRAVAGGKHTWAGFSLYTTTAAAPTSSI